jgi:hypothetical protein
MLRNRPWWWMTLALTWTAVVVARPVAAGQTAPEDVGRELASLRRELQALRAEVESLKSARTVTAAEACAGREWHVGRREPEVYGKRIGADEAAAHGRGWKFCEPHGPDHHKSAEAVSRSGGASSDRAFGLPWPAYRLPPCIFTPGRGSPNRLRASSPCRSRDAASVCFARARTVARASSPYRQGGRARSEGAGSRLPHSSGSAWMSPKRTSTSPCSWPTPACGCPTTRAAMPHWSPR